MHFPRTVTDLPTFEEGATMSSVVRKFIGWNQPVLLNVVKRLLDVHTRDGRCDLSGLLIVLPGGLAVRRLRELLVLQAQQSSVLLNLPSIVTVGLLPEQLYSARRPFANDIVQMLAWVSALKNAPSEELQLLIPNPPATEGISAGNELSNSSQWLELGRVLLNLHRELASDQLDFAAVAKSLGKNHIEARRWETLAKMQRHYLDVLHQLGLWDIETARLRALADGEASARLKIIVIGCVDLNRTQRAFLQAVAEQIEVWVAAPEELSSFFDPVGCLEAENWQSMMLDLPTDCLLVGNSPTDQAELTSSTLAELGDQFHLRDVTLGAVDATLIPELQHRLAQCNVSARFGAGRPLSKTEPVLLLQLIGDFLGDSSYPQFSALIRHPAVGRILKLANPNLPANWLSRVDDYHAATLVQRLDGFINQQAPGAEVFQTVSESVSKWLEPLHRRSMQISGWTQPLLHVLQAAYQAYQANPSDPLENRLIQSAGQLVELISFLNDIPKGIELKLSATELIDWLLRQLSGQLVPEAADPMAVEMLGWLELVLDDSPALIVVGMHDGVTPESVNADAFLPNQLRRQLGMMDNARRFARDMYSMQVHVATRKILRIIVGRFCGAGNPLVPSRLLLACPLAQLPARVLHLTQEDNSDVLPEAERIWKPTRSKSKLVVPKPQPVKAPTQITVTAFRDYIRCPYRYYLRHVLRIRDRYEELVEMNASMFGNLVHDVLDLFGKSSVKDSCDPEEIENFLLSQLRRNASQQFGPHPPAAVLIQVEQAEMRLTAFAEKQAERAAQGWEIRFTEQGSSPEDRVMVGLNSELCLVGRIDRIDYHPETGKWAIWDYKTSESAKKPESVHWSSREGWLDLQLPLYLPIAKKLGVTSSPSVGYIALPRRTEDINFYTANFEPDQLIDAWKQAGEIATRVANCEFWPEKIQSVDFDDFARICQVNTQQVAVAPPARQIRRYTGYQLHSVPADVAAKAMRRLNSPLQRTPISMPPLLIRASAGTGKTFQLSNRLLRIILSGQEVDSILATTFTRKAAGEIMQRVLQRLSLACIDAGARGQLAEHLEGVDTSADACLAALRRVTAGIHRLRICTLDSFFAQVARTFSLEMGLPAGWGTMEPSQESDRQLVAVAEMLDGHDRNTLVNLVRMLSKGESSRRVSEEVLSTVREGYAIFRMTNAEAWDRLPLQKAPDDTSINSALCTLENCRMQHARIDAELEKLHLLATTGQWLEVIQHTLVGKSKEEKPTYYRKELPSELITALRILSDKALGELLPIYRSQTLATFEILKAFDHYYHQLVQRYRSLAFADVAHYLSRWMHQELLAGKNAQGLALLEYRMDCGIQHLLLDEFQDTSLEQWEILQPLSRPLGERLRTDRSFFCVGDPKQAIYGWRGGVAEIFESVKETLPKLEEKDLSESFRSSPPIMETVNGVFQTLDRHSNFGGCEQATNHWQSQFPEHKTAKVSQPGYVCLENGPAFEDENLTADDKRILFLEYSADRIAKLTRQTSAGIGVLLRTNQDVATMIGLLRNRNVTASQYGGNPLTDSAAVELILSLIHLAEYPGDQASAFHVFSSPLKQDLPEGLRDRPTELSDWFRTLVFRQGLGRSVQWLADRMANQLSWWDQQRMEQLIRLAHDFENTGGSLRNFEGLVEEQRVALPSDSQVKVMTVHASKGLEFDAVFLPALEGELTKTNQRLVTYRPHPCQPPEGVLRYVSSQLQVFLPERWQDAFQIAKSDSLVESLCVLYVAMTRARRALYMFTQPKGKSSRQNMSSLLQSTLAGDSALLSEPQTELYVCGDANWFQSMPAVAANLPPSDSDRKAEPRSGKIRLKGDLASAPQRGLPTLAPSQTALPQQLTDLSDLFSLDRSYQAAFGKLIHHYLQQIRWIEDYTPQKARLKHFALDCLSPEEQRHISVEKAIDYFLEAIQKPTIREMLSRKRYQRQIVGSDPAGLQVETELAVQAIIGGQLVVGNIDRLILINKADGTVEAEIIDYKTDSPPKPSDTSWLNQLAARHRPQLELYSSIVSQHYSIPQQNIQKQLLLLSTGETFRFD
jgi:ATP-dependent exoDNAse (exonuclease V) beta subunit